MFGRRQQLAGSTACSIAIRRVVSTRCVGGSPVDPAQSWIRVIQERFPSQRSLVVASVIVSRTPLGDWESGLRLVHERLVLEWA